MFVTAHEVAHLENYERTRDGGPEYRIDLRAGEVLEKFKEHEEELLIEWNKEPARRPAKPKKSKQEIKKENAKRLLKQWETKLKLAKTKVAKYKKQVAYYNKAVA